MAEQNLWGTLLTGLGTAAINSYFNNKAIDKQNKFNEEQAELERQYETEMSNTAYQRAYEDMKKAGLNPNLAGGSGGASTPAGTAATSTGFAPFDLAGAMNANANAAATAMNTKWVPKKIKAEIGNIEGQTALTEAQTNNARKTFSILDAQSQKEIMSLATAFQETQNEEKRNEIEKKFRNTWWGRQMTYIGLSLSGILPILGPIGQMTRKGGGITINNN